MKIFVSPSPKSFDRQINKPSHGIRRVVEEVYSRLPSTFQIVEQARVADITVSHACAYMDADVFHCHGLYPTGELDVPPKFMWEINRRLAMMALRARVTTVPSPWVAEIFARDMGFVPVVLRHGLDISRWHEPDIRGKTRTVLWHKNRNSDVCGTEPLEQLASLRGDVRFLSTFGNSRRNLTVVGLQPHDKLKRLMYQHGILFAPTKETFGIGTLEAMAAGMPILGWDWGATPDIVGHKEHGYLAQPHNLEDTSEGLTYILDNYDRLAKAARIRAGEFDWDSVVKQYAQVYEQAAESHKGPEVSVIIPCYNYGEYVGRAIKSVKDQSFKDLECIIVDDGSADDSVQAIRKAIGRDKRFRLIEQKNQGVAAARNTGGWQSSGKFICFLDADDYITPTAVQELHDQMVLDPTLGIGYSRLSVLWKGSVRNGAWPAECNFDRQVRGKNQVPTFNMMRREAFVRSGGFRQRLAPAEDAEEWLRVGLLGWNIQKVTDNRLFVYRVRDDSDSASAKVRQGKDKEPDWTEWLPGPNGGYRLFASRESYKKVTHPVRNYENPHVSIVIPVGPGHEDLVLDAIDSVFAQTYPYWECIVVDDTKDGNLQDHGDIPYRIKFPYVKWLRCGKQNASAARNMGAEAAKAPYLIFLDADDVLKNEFLERTMFEAKECPNSMIYTDWIELPSGNIHRSIDFKLDKVKSQSIFAVTFLHPKQGWIDVGGFDEGLVGWEDWDYQIALAMKGYCGVRVPEALFGYRYQTGSRREQSFDIRQQLLPTIRSKWIGVEDMPCRGCGGRVVRRKYPNMSATQGGDPVELPRNDTATELMEVEYVGSSSGARLYKCPSGGRYRFGAGQHSRKLVRADDAGWFSNMADFRVRTIQRQAPKREPEPEPEQEPEIAEPERVPEEDIPNMWDMSSNGDGAKSDEVSLQDVDGLSNFLRERLSEFGIRTVGDVQTASVKVLRAIPGIGPRRAEEIKEAVGDGTS